jgi:hypothetical protein
MSVPNAETVETVEVERVLVKATGGLSGDNIIGEDGTCSEGGSEGEGSIVGGRDGVEGVTDTETDTVDAGVREGDVGEYVIDGDSLEGLSSIGLNPLGSREVYAEAVGRKKDVSNEISGPSGKAIDCTEGEAPRIDDSYVSSVSGAHRDSRIEGLEGTRGGLAERRDGVIVLGVDSVTDVVVVGSVPRERIGEGPGKGGGTAYTGREGAAADRSERETVDRAGLDTEDSGNGAALAILVVETIDGMVPISEGEVVGEGLRGVMENPGST